MSARFASLGLRWFSPLAGLENYSVRRGARCVSSSTDFSGLGFVVKTGGSLRFAKGLTRSLMRHLLRLMFLIFFPTALLRRETLHHFVREFPDIEFCLVEIWDLSQG